MVLLCSARVFPLYNFSNSHIHIHFGVSEELCRDYILLRLLTAVLGSPSCSRIRPTSTAPTVDSVAALSGPSVARARFYLWQYRSRSVRVSRRGRRGELVTAAVSTKPGRPAITASTTITIIVIIAISFAQEDQLKRRAVWREVRRW